MKIALIAASALLFGSYGVLRAMPGYYLFRVALIAMVVGTGIYLDALADHWANALALGGVTACGVLIGAQVRR